MADKEITFPSGTKITFIGVDTGEEIKSLNKREQPSLEEAIKYIEDFGGIDKAVRRNYLSMFITYDDYSYHKMCVQVYLEWFVGYWEGEG